MVSKWVQPVIPTNRRTDYDLRTYGTHQVHTYLPVCALGNHNDGYSGVESFPARFNSLTHPHSIPGKIAQHSTAQHTTVENTRQGKQQAYQKDIK